MKRSLLLIALTVSVSSHALAAVGDMVSGNGSYVADGIVVSGIGTVAASSIEIAAAGYTFKAGEDAKLQAGADLMMRSMSDLQSEVSLNLHDLTLESGSELSSNQVITVAGEFRAAGAPTAATYALRSSMTPVSSVDADLDLTGEATAIILEHSVNMNGHQLRLLSDTPITLNYDAADSNVPFFANVGQLLVTTTDGTELELAPGSDVTQYLTLYSNGTPLKGVSIIYSTSGDISLTVPEPSGAALSLLAPVGPATHRRRKH